MVGADLRHWPINGGRFDISICLAISPGFTPFACVSPHIHHNDKSCHCRAMHSFMLSAKVELPYTNNPYLLWAPFRGATAC